MGRILIGNIKGPQGPRGIQGVQGPIGPIGPVGPLPPLINNALATQAGVAALDAVMGKTLGDKFDKLNSDLIKYNQRFLQFKDTYFRISPNAPTIYISLVDMVSYKNKSLFCTFRISQAIIKSGVAQIGFFNVQNPDTNSSFLPIGTIRAGTASYITLPIVTALTDNFDHYYLGLHSNDGSINENYRADVQFWWIHSI